MTTARLIEHRITRELLQRPRPVPAFGTGRWVERLISVLALTAGLLMLGSYAPELLWALLAGAAVFTMGTRTG